MKKNKEIYIIFLWLALILVTFFVFILPNFNKITTIAAQVAKTKAYLEDLQKTGQDKKEALKNYQMIKENINTLDSIIPKHGEELTFITTLEEIANKNQLAQTMNIFLNEKTGVEARAGTNNKLPFQLTLDGHLDNFFNYLNDLEKINYYLNIDKVQISQSSGGPTSIPFEEFKLMAGNNIHAVLTGFTYWQ